MIVCRSCGADLTGSRNPLFCNRSCRTSWTNRHRGYQERVNRTAMNAVELTTMLDIAWVAGIFEGEGCVGPSGTRNVRACVVQKDTWLLHRCLALFGGSIYMRKTGTSRCGSWYVSGPRARGFLLTIFPFLSPRRRQQVRKVLWL